MQAAMARKFTVAAAGDRSTSWKGQARRSCPESRIRRVKRRDEHSDNDRVSLSARWADFVGDLDPRDALWAVHAGCSVKRDLSTASAHFEPYEADQDEIDRDNIAQQPRHEQD